MPLHRALNTFPAVQSTVSVRPSMRQAPFSAPPARVNPPSSPPAFPGGRGGGRMPWPAPFSVLLSSPAPLPALPGSSCHFHTFGPPGCRFAAPRSPSPGPYRSGPVLSGGRPVLSPGSPAVHFPVPQIPEAFGNSGFSLISVPPSPHSQCGTFP